MVCAVWSEDQWTAVDAVVAREEANTILKASGRTAHSNGKVSPADVSADKPRKGKKAKKTKSDKVSANNRFYDPTDTMDNVFSPRAPELRRTNEALQVARRNMQEESTDSVDSTTPPLLGCGVRTPRLPWLPT